MTRLAIALYVVYLLVAFVVRTVIQVRRTGDSGFRGLSGRPGTAQWWAGVLFAVALVVGAAAPVAGAVGLPTIGWLDQPVVNITGVGLAIAGIALTLAAQFRMGSECVSVWWWLMIVSRSRLDRRDTPRGYKVKGMPGIPSCTGWGARLASTA